MVKLFRSSSMLYIAWLFERQKIRKQFPHGSEIKGHLKKHEITIHTFKDDGVNKSKSFYIGFWSHFILFPTPHFLLNRLHKLISLLVWSVLCETRCSKLTCFNVNNKNFKNTTSKIHYFITVKPQHHFH